MDGVLTLTLTFKPLFKTWEWCEFGDTNRKWNEDLKITIKLSFELLSFVSLLNRLSANGFTVNNENMLCTMYNYHTM